jgi:hypothetical protein
MKNGGCQNTMGNAGQNTMGKWVNIPWERGVQNAMGFDPFTWYIDTLTRYYDPPIHDILTPYPWYIDPIPVVF